jgi:hypothetical protein
MIYHKQFYLGHPALVLYLHLWASLMDTNGTFCDELDEAFNYLKLKRKSWQTLTRNCVFPVSWLDCFDQLERNTIGCLYSVSMRTSKKNVTYSLKYLFLLLLLNVYEMKPSKKLWDARWPRQRRTARLHRLSNMDASANHVLFRIHARVWALKSTGI